MKFTKTILTPNHVDPDYQNFQWDKEFMKYIRCDIGENYADNLYDKFCDRDCNDVCIGDDGELYEVMYQCHDQYRNDNTSAYNFTPIYWRSCKRNDVPLDKDYHKCEIYGQWDMDEVRELCDDAGLLQEWEDADGDNFSGVIYKAAKILGIELISDGKNKRRYLIKWERNLSKKSAIRFAENAYSACKIIAEQYGWFPNTKLIDADTRGKEWAKVGMYADRACFDWICDMFAERVDN